MVEEMQPVCDVLGGWRDVGYVIILDAERRHVVQHICILKYGMWCSRYCMLTHGI